MTTPRFYMVWSPQGRAPTVRHRTYHDAKTEARRLAAFIKPMDDYALVSVKDNVVVVFTAKGQSLRAMDRAEFQQSKDAVLQILGDMLSVTPAELLKNAGAAA